MEKVHIPTIEAAQEYLRENGYDVRECVFPTLYGMCYYITESGDVFSCKQCNSRGVFRIHKLHPRIYPDVGISFRMQGIDGQVDMIVHKLLYCTYVLGYWDDKLKIHMKDGDRCNIRLDNMERVDNIQNPQLGKRMEQAAVVYAQSFGYISHYIEYEYYMRREDAQDIVQDAFVALCNGYGDVSNFAAKWMEYSKKAANGFCAKSAQFCNIEDMQNARMSVRQPEACADILAACKDQNQRRLLQLAADGYTLREMSQETGINLTYISEILHDARAIMRKYLRNEAA